VNLIQGKTIEQWQQYATDKFNTELQGGTTEMANIKQEAESYETPQAKNIAELDKVSTELEVVEETFKEGEDDEFKLKIAKVDGIDYRVPVSVLKSLKEILKVKPNLKTFKVQRSGEGMKTAYTVIPLE